MRQAEGQGIYLELVEEAGGRAGLRPQHQHGSWREGGDRSPTDPALPAEPAAPCKAGMDTASRPQGHVGAGCVGLGAALPSLQHWGGTGRTGLRGVRRHMGAELLLLTGGKC